MLQSLHTQTQEYLNTTVKPAIDSLQSGTIPTSKIQNGAVTNAKLASSGLDASKFTVGTLPLAQLPDLPASKIPDLPASSITSGTFDAARIPSLAASKITSGTFAAARIPSLDASKIATGTIDAARLPAISSAGLAANSVTSSQIAANAVTTSKIPTGAITIARTNFVKTSLDATLDTEVPTSKAIATYVGNNAPQNGVFVAPPGTKSNYTTRANMDWTITKNLPKEITLSSFSAVKIVLNYYGFAPVDEGGSGGYTLNIIGKDSGGTSKTYRTTLQINTYLKSQGGATGTAVAYINKNGFGGYSDTRNDATKGAVISYGAIRAPSVANTAMPATITGLQLEYVGGSDSMQCWGFAFEICGVY
jgi:hypothetical protein